MDWIGLDGGGIIFTRGQQVHDIAERSAVALVGDLNYRRAVILFITIPIQHTRHLQMVDDDTRLLRLPLAHVWIQWNRPRTIGRRAENDRKSDAII